MKAKLHGGWTCWIYCVYYSPCKAFQKPKYVRTFLYLR